jgi:hypothetical protein
MSLQARMFLAMLHESADGSGAFDAEGRPQGPWLFTGADDAVVAEGLLDGGVPHGTWRVWDRGGQLRSMSEWDRGVPCGRWVTWAADGSVERVDVKGDEAGQPVVVIGTHKTLHA